MLVNFTYNDPERKKAVEKLVGKPIKFFKRFSNGGIGYARLKVLNCSEEVQKLFDYDHNLNTVIIEKRQSGILIWFRSLLESYVVAIPYYQLVLYRNGLHYSIYGNGFRFEVCHMPEKKIKHAFFNQLIKDKSLAISSAF